jgi:hypothetical protein
MMNEQQAKDAARERQIEALKAAPPKPIAYEQSSVSYYTAGFDDGWQLAIEYYQQAENQRYRTALREAEDALAYAKAGFHTLYDGCPVDNSTFCGNCRRIMAHNINEIDAAVSHLIASAALGGE